MGTGRTVSCKGHAVRRLDASLLHVQTGECTSSCQYFSLNSKYMLYTLFSVVDVFHNKKILISWKSQVENISKVSKEKPCGGAVIQSEEWAPRRSTENTTQTKAADTQAGRPDIEVKCNFSRAHIFQYKRDEKTLDVVLEENTSLHWKELGAVWSLGTAVTPALAQTRCPPEPEPEPEPEPIWEEWLEVRSPGGNHQIDKKMKKSIGVWQGARPRGDRADELELTSVSIKHYWDSAVVLIVLLVSQILISEREGTFLCSGQSLQGFLCSPPPFSQPPPSTSKKDLHTHRPSKLCTPFSWRWESHAGFTREKDSFLSKATDECVC